MSKRVLSASASKFADIVNQINVSSKPVSLVKHAGIIPGGFPYSAFNGGAKVRPEALLSTVESTRLTLFNKATLSPVSYLDADKIYKDHFMFINAAKIHMDSRIYDIALCKAPLYFDTVLENIGKTSTQLKTTFYLENDPKPLLTSRITTVLVCNKLRKPKPPPDWWMDKYANTVEKGGEPIGKLEFNSGDETKSTKSQFRIMPSDCDPYRHTNWGNYIRYCHDAIGDHMMEMRGDRGYEEFFNLGLKNLSVLYKKESCAGDLISVKVSPAMNGEQASSSDNGHDVNSFYLKVESDSNVLCESKLEYYPTEQ